MAVGAERLVCPRDDGQIGYADNNDATQTNRPLWLTMNAWGSGVVATVTAYGIVTYSGWSWIPNEPVFLGHTGLLTQTPPTLSTPAVFSVVVAEVVSPTSLFFNPSLPIVL